MTPSENPRGQGGQGNSGDGGSGNPRGQGNNGPRGQATAEENQVTPADITSEFRQGIYTDLKPGARFIAYQLSLQGFLPQGIEATTSGTHTDGSNHYSGEALDYGDATNDMDDLWAILSPFENQFLELLGPERLSGAAQDHEDHIHVAVEGSKMVNLGDGSVTNGGSGGGGSLQAGGESLAKAAAFATFFQLASALEVQRSTKLTGEKSLMNDKPLFPFIQQLTEASMRNFQSMPNGNFFAFYPDYFGGMGHRTPYWTISDMEIIDGNIDLSDNDLATHVYIVGSTSGSMSPTIGITEELQSAGVVTIFNAFMVDFLNGNYAPDVQDPYETNPPRGKAAKKVEAKGEKWRKKQESLANKDNAVAFLKKYGARPHYEQEPLIRSPYYELFLAYQRFCLLWSKQFLTTFELTFMPELFPGGLIELGDHGIQCYIDEVSHNCSYEGGFTTTVNLSAPAAIDGKARSDINQGMVRAGIFGSNGPQIKTGQGGNAGEAE